MKIFKTPKEIARGFLLVSGTLIIAGLYFVPVVMQIKVESDLYKYLTDCRDKFEIIYTMLVTFYLRDKAQHFFAGKDREEKQST